MKPKLSNVIFEITSKCNLKCRYCYNFWKRPGESCEEKESYSQTIKTLKKFFKMVDVRNITFTGGEPFLSERFLEVVLFAKMQKKSVTLITNGTIATENEYKILSEMAETTFELTINSYKKEEHDKISGVEGSWEKTVNSVKFLKNLGKRVVVVIVATKYNIHNIEGTINFIRNLGINEIMLNRYNIGGISIEDIDNILISEKELKDLYKMADKICGETDIKIFTNVCTPFCVLDYSEYKYLKLTSCTQRIDDVQALLDMNGNIRICNHSPVVLGNIFKESWSEITNSEQLKKWQIKPKQCQNCNIFDRCKGGCRAASEQTGAGVENVDPIVTIYRNKRESSC